ncbi:DUF1349 domain-containing protein [Dactylosporangium darangshiense]|uniref:hypothetical protein n=1 Tax=Dactylosporangium darangshiense TaxID=579108 RepID=UPI00363E55B9
MKGFLRLLRAEWTKLRTVRGWALGLAAGALLILAFGLTPSRQGSCGQNGPGSECTPLHGPSGQEVSDSFTFVHRTLTGDGTVTARIAGLTGVIDDGAGGQKEHLVPWAKAGLIVKDGTTQGSAYGAVMLTGEHGVRLQYGYDHDEGHAADAAIRPQPMWLRLTRTGDVLKAERSADGAAWTTVGTARVPGLPATVTAGLFVTSPQYSERVNQGVVLSGVQGGPSEATATFDHLATAGSWSPDWEGTVIGPHPGPGDGGGGGPAGGHTARAAGPQAGFEPTADGWSLTGSGDIAPAASGASGGGVTVSQTLIGTFVGLIAVVVIGAMFITAEFRRGLIRTTFAAAPAAAGCSPRRPSSSAASRSSSGSPPRGSSSRSAWTCCGTTGCTSTRPRRPPRPASSSAPPRCWPVARCSPSAWAPCCAAASPRSPSRWSWSSCRTCCRSRSCRCARRTGC